MINNHNLIDSYFLVQVLVLLVVKHCEDYGFLHVINHNVTSINDCFNEAEKVFSLPTVFKNQCLCNGGTLGYASR